MHANMHMVKNLKYATKMLNIQNKIKYAKIKNKLLTIIISY